MRNLLFILTFIPFAGKSQLILDVANNLPALTSASFNVNAVIDSFQTRTIGRVFLPNQQSTMPVKLSKPIDEYFAELTTKIIRKTPDSDSINLIINYLTLTERKVGGIIEGQVSLTASYESSRCFGEIFLLKKTTKVVYKRTFGSKTASNFEKLIADIFRENVQYFVAWKNLNAAIHPGFIKSSEVIIKPPYTKNVNDTIYYDSRPITWDDFRGELPLSSRYGASIFSNIAFNLEMTIQNHVLRAYFTPKVYMVRGMSWVRSSSQNEYSLEHEKLHFDLTKIAMNRYVKKVQQINELTPDDLQSRIQYEYLEAYREMNRLQKMYDAETGHGSNQSTQAFWRTQVDRWLQD